MDFNTIKFKLSIDDIIHNKNRPSNIAVICFDRVNGLTSISNTVRPTYKLTDRPDDQIPIYLVAFNDRDINDSQVCRIMVRNTADGFEYVDRDSKNIFGLVVHKPLSDYIITQALL